LIDFSFGLLLFFILEIIEIFAKDIENWWSWKWIFVLFFVIGFFKKKKKPWLLYELFFIYAQSMESSKS
jgi:hypothetical protein